MNREWLIEQLESVYKKYSKKYVRVYVDFCLDRCKKNKSIDTYTERHHILPKGIPEFKKYEKFVENDWNMSVLSAREHYIAHKILSKAIPSSTCAINAFYLMSNIKTYKKYVTSRDYEKAKLLRLEIQKNSIAFNKDGQIIITQKENKDKYINDGWSLGYGISYIRMYKGDDVKAFDPNIEDIQSYLDDGWTIGSGLKGKKTIVYRITDTGIESKNIFKKDIDEHLNNGWNMGRGVSKDKGYILIYKYDVDFFDTRKIDPDRLESFTRKGYLVGLPVKLSKGYTALQKYISNIKVKMKVKKVYKDVLMRYGWAECPYDIFSNKFITDGYFIIKSHKKIKNYIDAKCNDFFIKDEYLFNVGKNPSFIHKESLLIQVNEDEIEEYLKNGWVKGTNLNPQRNKAFIYKIINGENVKKVVDKSEEKDYLKNGWKKGTGVSNVSGYKHIHRYIDGVLESKMVAADEIDSYLKNGWRRGRKFSKR